MAFTMLANKRTIMPFGVGATPSRVRVAPVRAPQVITHSYKNMENINLSKLPEFARSDSDTGSPEYQVARLCARVEQLGGHLKINKKDNSALRGLQNILAQRKKLLQYLYRMDREKYYNIIRSFGIRSVIVGDSRGTTREKTAVAA